MCFLPLLYPVCFRALLIFAKENQISLRCPSAPLPLICQSRCLYSGCLVTKLLSTVKWRIFSMEIKQTSTCYGSFLRKVYLTMLAALNWVQGQSERKGDFGNATTWIRVGLVAFSIGEWGVSVGIMAWSVEDCTAYVPKYFTFQHWLGYRRAESDVFVGVRFHKIANYTESVAFTSAALPHEGCVERCQGIILVSTFDVLPWIKRNIF